ncbi:MAG: alpha/beta hydrolase [Clostridia bacterium]|nr:alpha/beta hydrolase [Clostridia bacterium]
MFLMNTERIYLYEGNEDIYLDLYVMNDSRLAMRDGMLIIPGGGYGYVCMDREGEKTALAYLARGVNAYVLNYRCAKTDVFPMHLEYAARAMRWIKENAASHNTNPERVFVSGFSAGGHLAATLTTKYAFIEEKLGLEKDTAKPKGAVLSYPVITAIGPCHKGSFSSLLNKPFQEITDEEKAFHSVENHVNSDTPPAFIWHTSEDKSVPVHSSLKLALAYADAGVPFALHVYPYGPHGIALATEYSNPADSVSSVQPMAARWLEDSIEWMKTIK